MKFIPWWLAWMLPKKYFVLRREYKWDTFTDEYIIKEYQDEMSWKYSLECIDYKGNYYNKVCSRLNQLIIPQMYKRNLFNK